MMRRVVNQRAGVCVSLAASCAGLRARESLKTSPIHQRPSLLSPLATAALVCTAHTHQRRPFSITQATLSPNASTTPSLVSSLNSFQQFEWKNPDRYLSPYDLPKCPLDVIVLYNPSPHANNVAVEDLLRVWPNVQIVQTVAEGRPTVVGVTHYMSIPKGSWGDMEMFSRVFSQYRLRNRYIRNLQVGFYPVWSSMAEDSQIARAVKQMGIHWIGAAPEAMDGLGKVEYKTFCDKNSLPTAPFFTISPADGEIDTAKFPVGSDAYFSEAARLIKQNFESRVKGTPLEGKECFIKSEYGGGGRGTKKAKPTNESLQTAIEGVLSETKKINGIYCELALDLAGASLYQLEMEVDAGSIVDGGRLVYFNARNQKMVELGFSAAEITKFIPKDIFVNCTKATGVIARDSKYDGRGTNEILIAKMPNGEWQYFCSEFNKRIQVEHKALSYLYRYRGEGDGELFNTVADQVMRSCGYRPPDYTKDLEPSGSNAVGHVRLISPAISPTGDISFPVGVEIDASILPKGFNVTATLNPGKLYSDTDAQFGVALVRERSWTKLRKSLLQFSYDTVILGKNVKRDYFRFLQKFFSDDRTVDLSLGCNKTFDVLNNPTQPDSIRAKAMNHLANGVSHTIVNGYRPDAGVKNRGWPTRNQIDAFRELRDKMLMTKIPTKRNPFLDLLVDLDEDKYFHGVRKLLQERGGGMVSVFPRDVQQECGSSESHIITPMSRMLMERYGPRCGFLGQEQGGAQYQTAEMNGMNSFNVLEQGLLCNMPTWSLTRSHWMNALEKLNIEEVKFILKVTRDRVQKRFVLDNCPNKSSSIVPYFPYNFHAGNVPEQDEVTSAMLECGMIPLPNFVWDPRFTLEDFDGWVRRQLSVWKQHNRTLHSIRIKNAGQQKEWTAENVYVFVDRARQLYKEAYGADSGDIIIHIHNHNFNGLASHVAYELLRLCQRNGYNQLVVDTAPPLMTHNNNLVVARALKLTDKEKEYLHSYNEAAHTVWRLTERFHDFLQVRVDPDTVWAGGTGSSDLAAAEKLGIHRSEIESAKLLGARLSGLGGIVTPYSQWSMVIGYTCYKAGLKSLEAVTEHIMNGGTLPLPKNILQGLHSWQTLLKRPPLVDTLLANHQKSDPDLFRPKSAKTKPTFDRAAVESKILSQLPHASLTDETVARVLAYGDIAMKTIISEDKGMDNNWLVKRPDVAYDRHIPNGKTFKVDGMPVTYEGTEDIPESADVLVTYKFEGHTVRVTVTDKEKQASISNLIATQVVMADPSNPSHVGAFMPGVCETIGVKVGQTIAEGDVLYSINSMKMVTAFKATKAHAGKTVEAIHASAGAELAYNAAGAAPLVMTLK